MNSSDVVAAVVWAPVTEEFGKGLFLILLVVLRPRHLHGPLDGAIYAALVGIGFSFVEDTLYYSVGFVGGGPETLVALVVLRGVLGAFSHSIYAALFGIGIGVAVQTRSPAVRVLAPLAGFVAAVLMHALWNGSVTFFDQLGFLAAYVLVMLPVLGVLIALGILGPVPGGSDDPRRRWPSARSSVSWPSTRSSWWRPRESAGPAHARGSGGQTVQLAISASSRP